MMAQNAVAAATAPASGAGIGCWSFQTPGPVSSRSSGAKADGGLPSRSDIATGTGPRGRRTPVAAGRVQPLTPVEFRPLPSAPALQIPELLPSPVLQSASSADAPRPAARPPLPLLVSFRPLREAQLALAQPRRFPALRVDPVHDHVHVRVSAPVRHDQRLVLLRPQRLQALRRLLGLNSAAPAPHPWPSYRHMDAIWTPQQIASPYTIIDLAVKHLLFMHLLQCPARDSNPEPTD